MTTTRYVPNVLVHAFSILPPYPWAAHVELILFDVWGVDTPKMVTKAKRLFADVCTMPSQRGTPMWTSHSRDIRIELDGFGVFSASGWTVPACMRPPFNILLPDERVDPFWLSWVEQDAAEEYRLMIGKNGSRMYQPMDRMLWPCAEVDLVKRWMIELHKLAVDILDSDQIMCRASAELSRPYGDIVRSIYPSWQVAFGGDTGVVSKRPPIAAGTLRTVIHPHDQEVIRTTLDKAAGGRRAGNEGRTLLNYTLNYESEG